MDFFRLNELETLYDECSTNNYPPRIVLEVSSEYAEYPSFIQLTFTGADEDFSTEIQLRRPRSENHAGINKVKLFTDMY